MPALKQLPGIVGRFFHSVSDDMQIKEQGRVVSLVEPGHYLVECYSFIDGQVAYLRIVTLSALMHCQFYEDAEHMKFWAEYRAHKPREAAE